MRNLYLWGAVAGISILPVICMAAMARRSAPPPIWGRQIGHLLPCFQRFKRFQRQPEGPNCTGALAKQSLRGGFAVAPAGFAEVMKRFHGEAQQTVFLTLWVGMLRLSLTPTRQEGRNLA